MATIWPKTIQYPTNYLEHLPQNNQYDQRQASPSLRISSLEETLAAARPRLLRLAQRKGVAPDALDDIVQESLLDAWRQLHTLRQPERFGAWLDGICRNRCLRWSQAQKHQQRHTSLSEDVLQEHETHDLDIPDPAAWDPTEELNRQDLATLIDRALGYLSPDARKVVELCYLAEHPQREVAFHLRLPLNVLEARLNRARRRLHQVLTTELRSDALAFGLTLPEKPDGQWRESREWCWFCGRHRLIGMFEPLSNGRVSLVMRCPACSVVVNTGGWPQMDGVCAFRPALKRLFHTTARLASGLEEGTHLCPICDTPQSVEVLHPNELATTYPDSPNIGIGRSILVLDCASCQAHVENCIDGSLWSLPMLQRFRAEHPRAFSERETIIEHEGEQAMRLCWTDIASASRLTLIVHHRTLRVLSLYQS